MFQKLLLFTLESICSHLLFVYVLVFIYCMYVVCTHICAPCVCLCLRGQQRASDSPGLSQRAGNDLVGAGTVPTLQHFFFSFETRSHYVALSWTLLYRPDWLKLTAITCLNSAIKSIYHPHPACCCLLLLFVY